MTVRFRFGIFCCLICGMFFLFAACRFARTDRLAACKSPFCASVAGELNNEAFSAQITVTANERRISFSSPAVLEGLELTLSGERVTLSKNGIEVQTDAESMRGLALPLILLTETDSTPQQVEKQGDQYTLTFEGNISFTVSDRGLPRFVSFPEGSFRVTDFSPV